MLENSDVLRLIVYALAVLRVTNLLWVEEGPWEVFAKLRSTAGIHVAEKNQGTWENGNYTITELQGQRIATTFFGKLLNCPMCISVWLSVPAVVAFSLKIWWLDLLAVWLAISGLCVIYYRIGDK